jgi:hypothetical protein
VSTRQRAEATKKPAPASEGLSLTWRDKTFRIPTAEQFPLTAMEAEEAGKPITALRELLGEDQYRTLRTVAFTAMDIAEFSGHVMKELGRGNP